MDLPVAPVPGPPPDLLCHHSTGPLGEPVIRLLCREEGIRDQVLGWEAEGVTYWLAPVGDPGSPLAAAIIRPRSLGVPSELCHAEATTGFGDAARTGLLRRLILDIANALRATGSPALSVMPSPAARDRPLYTALGFRLTTLEAAGLTPVSGSSDSPCLTLFL